MLLLINDHKCRIRSDIHILTEEGVGKERGDTCIIHQRDMVIFRSRAWHLK